jgi:hypothetical protein
MPNTYTLIASSTVGSGGAATITFSSIASTYTDLLLVSSLRSNGSFTNQDLVLTFNGSSANLSQIFLIGTGSVLIGSGSTDFFGGTVNGATSTADTFSNNSVYIPNYTNTTANKSGSIDGVRENNATNTSTYLGAGLRSNTAAITSITLGLSSDNFVQYSTAYLYGIVKS